jgi:uncharacterized protein (DUF362 family)
MGKVSKVLVKENLKDALYKAIEAIAPLDKFIKKGDVVLIKPNFNTADPPPASTDIDFLKTVVDIIYDAQPKLVMIGESSTMTTNTKKVLEKVGVFNILNSKKPARIYVFEEFNWIQKEIKNGKYLKNVSITEIIEKPDKIVLLPCLKTHKYAQFTGSLKLAVGFMKPIERISLHLSFIQEKIAELNTLFTPNLIIMDARKCFISKGPQEGEIKTPNLILASSDRIAIDVEGIKIIQSFKGNSLYKFNPWQIPQIKRAIELNIGAKNENEYEVIEIN